MVHQHHRPALERSADLPVVGPELLDDTGVEVAQRPSSCSGQVRSSNTHTAMINAAAASNQNNAAHIPPDTPVNRAS
ncbi:hypothetical protein PSD17_47990 [Pseudonocardia sp. D17]|nr:hypothetical protein PSD17_47990 [Pseudonocardia sp. D17]